MHRIMAVRQAATGYVRQKTARSAPTCRQVVNPATEYVMTSAVCMLVGTMTRIRGRNTEFRLADSFANRSCKCKVQCTAELD